MNERRQNECNEWMSGFAELLSCVVELLMRVLIMLPLVMMPLLLGMPLQANDSIVVVVLDDSGSMGQKMRTNSGSEPRMAVAKTALTKVVQQLPDDTTLGVLLMNGARSENGWLVPLAPLDRQLALRKVSLVRADGGTPLGHAMKTAMDELLRLRSKQPYGDYRLLVVTDGEATDANVLEQYLPDMIARGVSIDAIGVDMKSEHTLAKRAHSYRRANDAASFEKALTEIFAESATGGINDGGPSDYELLAGLPDEFAAESLKALSQAQNGAVVDRMTINDAHQPAVPMQNPSGNQPPAPKENFNPLPFLVVAVIVYTIIQALRQKNKKRRS